MWCCHVFSIRGKEGKEQEEFGIMNYELRIGGNENLKFSSRLNGKHLLSLNL